MGMTSNQLALVRAVAENKFQEAKKIAIACCVEDTTAKNKYAVQRYKNLLENNSTMLELPYNIKGMAILEDVSNFRVDRYYLSKREADLLEKIKQINQASLKLMELNIPYLNSILLIGNSGTGKTMFGRYVAKELKLPFLYINFSYLIDSYMGNTSKNLRAIFDYAKVNKCLLMLDEIDAIARQRNKNDSGANREYSNTTITLLQELDQIKNDSILIGATNIPDALDQAVIRRFAIKHEVKYLNKSEIIELVNQYIATLPNYTLDCNLDIWADKMIGIPQSDIINKLIEAISIAIIENKFTISL